MLHNEAQAPYTSIGTLCFGAISDIDPSRGYVRVAFLEHDDDDDENPAALVSDWIPFLTRKSQFDKETFPYDIGEQVACMMDDYCEQGCVMGATFNDEDAPDGASKDKYRIKFKDGSFEQFDRSNGNKELSYSGGLKTTCANDCEFMIRNYKVHSSLGGVHEIGVRHKISNSSADLKTALMGLIAQIKLMTFTNGGGVTLVANNAPAFAVIEAQLNALLE